MRVNKKKTKTIFVVLLFASWFTTGGRPDWCLISPSSACQFGLAVRLVSGGTSVLISLQLSSSLQKLWSVDTVFRLCPSQLWNIKMALITAHLNAGVILVVTVYDRYIIPPPPPPHKPFDFCGHQAPCLLTYLSVWNLRAVIWFPLQPAANRFG